MTSDRKITCAVDATLYLALAAIDEEIRYCTRMAEIFGDDKDLINAGAAYAHRAELWQWIRDRVKDARLHDYLEQPDVLMSIPQPHRLEISRLLHE